MVFTIFMFLLVLGILVVVHELGHLLAAKSVGARVEKFSIGFGPKIFGIKRGETEYVLSIMPWGGYVKISGQEAPEGEKPEPFELCSKGKLARLFVYVAGPLSNLLLAIVLFPLILAFGVAGPAHYDEPAKIGWVEQHSPADGAGMMSGDLIVEVDGQPTPTWENLLQEVATRPEKDISLVMERDGKRQVIHLKTTQNKRMGTGEIGVMPPLPPLIAGVSKGHPASDAGLEKGDLIVSVDGVQVIDWTQLRDLVRGSQGKRLTLEIKRGGLLLTKEVTPVQNEDDFYVIGISAPQAATKLKKYPPHIALYKGVGQVYSMTEMTLSLLYKLVSGQASIKSLGGPIMIATISGRAAKAGPMTLLNLIAFLSVQLFILNLLPIPILDGGHVLFLAVETIMRRPVSIRLKEISSRIWFVILIAFMLLVSYNDILRFID